MGPAFRRVAYEPRVWLVAWAFVLRLAWVMLVPSRPVGDFALYREAAEHLLDQGHLDGAFVYMPGYVMLLAAVRGLGGDLLAAKMIGVVAGTVVAFASGGIAHALFGKRAGVAATLLAVIWPAGIAASSVTGTDMPAAALGALGVYALVSVAPRRPWLAAILCGLILGLAAWVRAVAVPLAALSVIYWLAGGARWPAALGRAALALVIAFTVLLPWGLRNQRVYGELFFTDSHGGHTALVGANPNSEGAYSRSLNVMFSKGTGYQLFEPPARHRQSDRAAYDLAKRWTAFEPLFAAGLVIAKADRLLTHERNLLYWPVYRQGVLDHPHRAFFDAHRTAFERVADGFWWAVIALAVVGVVACARQRQWAALSVLVFPAALAGIYTLFFAEVRYHLAIVPLLFPHAARAIDWLVGLARPARSGAPSAKAPVGGGFRPRLGSEARRTLLLAGATVAAVFACWSAVLAAGNILRARHRWAVAVCAYPRPTDARLCMWRRGLPAEGDSPLRGSWDGIGVRAGATSARGVLASAVTDLPVGAGRYRISAEVLMAGAGDGGSDVGGGGDGGGDVGGGRARGAQGQAVAVALRANGRVIARVVSPPSLLPIAGVVESTAAALRLEVEMESAGIGSSVDGTAIWLAKLLVERF